MKAVCNLGATIIGVLLLGSLVAVVMTVIVIPLFFWGLYLVKIFGV